MILERFGAPDEVRQMTLGRSRSMRIAGMTIGRATYQPGWRWSVHVGPGVGTDRCSVEHVGLADGRVVQLRSGDLFHIPPEPHDSWVMGDEPYVSLHFLGAERYAR